MYTEKTTKSNVRPNVLANQSAFSTFVFSSFSFLRCCFCPTSAILPPLFLNLIFCPRLSRYEWIFSLSIRSLSILALASARFSPARFSFASSTIILLYRSSQGLVKMSLFFNSLSFAAFLLSFFIPTPIPRPIPFHLSSQQA